MMDAPMERGLGLFAILLAGVAIRRMGGETPKFWNEIARQLR